MSDTPPNPAATALDGASCAVHPGGRAAARPAIEGGLLGGGCCSDDGGVVGSQAPMARGARRSRAMVGLVFLVFAGALGTRRLPGSVALWPASLVPTWFGISHLVAGVTGYQGCPELGAIPSVMLGRPVGTSCELWQRIDRWVERPGRRGALLVSRDGSPRRPRAGR
jgi:hypothetical protein